MVNLISEQLIQQATQTGYLSCKNIHDYSCFYHAFIRFFITIKSCSKDYIILYLIRLLVFQKKQLVQKPKEAIYQALINFLRSICFIGLFVSILIYSYCLSRNLRRKIDYLNSVIACFFCCLSGFVEVESRLQDINYYMIPRFFETILNLLKRRGINLNFQYANNFIYGIIMGLTIYLQNNDDSFSKAYKNLLNKILY